MMKLYADTHIPKQVVRQLRTQTIDIVRCEEVEMATASDDAHWLYAQNNERTILTHDDDFLVLASNAWLNGDSFHGIIYGGSTTQGNIGLIVRACLDLRDSDLKNQVIYISNYQ